MTRRVGSGSRAETGSDGGNASFRPSMSWEAQSRAAGPDGKTADVAASRKAASAGLVLVGRREDGSEAERGMDATAGGAGTAVWETWRDTGERRSRLARLT